MRSHASHARNTAAFNAVAAGHTHRLARLLAGGLAPDLVSRRSPLKGDLLRRAVRGGHRACARVLVAHGAIPDNLEWIEAISHGDAWAEEQVAWWPLWLKGGWGASEAKGFAGEEGCAAKEDASDSVIMSLRMALCYAPDVATVQRVLALVRTVGLKALPGSTSRAFNPMAHALRAGRFDVARQLLGAGACPKVALHLLVRAPMAPEHAAPAVELARECLAAGASLEHLPEGFNPSHALLPEWARAGNVEGVGLLLKYGAGRIPCAIAGSQAQMALVVVLSSQGMRSEVPAATQAILRLLLAHGASLEAPALYDTDAYASLRAWAEQTYPVWAANALDRVLPPPLASNEAAARL